MSIETNPSLQTKQDLYGSVPDKHSQRTLAVVGFVFDEAPRPPPARVAPGPQAHAPAASDAAGDSSGDDAADGSGSESSSESEDGEPGPAPHAGPERDSEGGAPSAIEAETGPAEAEAPEARVAPPRRVMGPAAPSAALLAAAAASMKDAPDYDSDEGARGGGAFDDMLVGPPPPELVMEMDAAPQDEREGEVWGGFRV